MVGLKRLIYALFNKCRSKMFLVKCDFQMSFLTGRSKIGVLTTDRERERERECSKPISCPVEI